MTPRRAAVVSWSLWAFAAVAIAAGTVLSTLYPFSSLQEAYDPVGEGLWAASWAGFGFVGALIVTRRPDNRIGWLLCVITFMLGVGVMTPVYGRVAFLHPGLGLPLGGLATWVAMWAITLVFGGVVALLLLFPSGALASKRQKSLGFALGLVALLSVATEAVNPQAPEGDVAPFNPLGVASLADPIAEASGIIGGLFAVVAALVLLDFVYRFWRSRGVQRQQFRWMVLAAATFPVLFMGAVVLEDSYLHPDAFDPVTAVFFLCGNGLAAAIGVAITRHGLYEINRVVSRTVGYALLTAVLVGVYLGAVTLLTAATAPIAGESPLAVAAATLLAAAVFGPARRRIQGAVDRRFNRARYDASVTAEAYRGRLRDEVDLENVADGLVETVLTCMQPASASLWLAGGGTLPEKSLARSSAVTVSERRREKKGSS